MANRRFEMHEYRHVIHRMRLGESDRTIAKTGLMGRLKCGKLREVAIRNGWLGDGPLPEDRQLSEIFEPAVQTNPTRQSLSVVHEERIKQWVAQNIWGTTIYRALAEQFGFTGSYSSVRHLVQKLRGTTAKEEKHGVTSRSGINDIRKPVHGFGFTVVIEGCRRK